MAFVLKKIGDLENTLKCPVCKKTFDDPVLINDCGHTFCKACVEESEKCPKCNIIINHKNKRDDKEIRETIPLVQQLKSLIQNELLEPNKSFFEKEAMEIAETPIDDNNSVSVIEDCVCPQPKTPSKTEKSTPSVRRRTQRTVKRKTFTSPVSAKYSPLRRAQQLKKLKTSPKTSIEKKNFKGETLLHVAVIKGDVKRVKDLLKMKANPNTKDHAGWTPLHEASNHGYLEITKILLDSGAMVNAPGENNITPLHDAIMNGKTELAVYLISRGADIEAKTSSAETVLHMGISEETKNALVEARTQYLIADTDEVQTITEKVVLRNKTKVVILSTSLDDNQRETLSKCAKIIKAEIVDDFSKEVTHIVTTCNESGHCNRTLKILQGIVSGKWIVNFEWINVCLEHKKRISEEAFEVPGTKHQLNTNAPRLSRENSMKEFPSLFYGCHFYLSGQFKPPMPSKEELSEIVQLAGGQIIIREPKEDTVNFDSHLIPYHAADGPFQNVSHFVLYQEKPVQSHKSTHIANVSVMWFIQSICAFKLLEDNV